MKLFNIAVIDEKPLKIDKKLCCLGQIKIGNFVERFFMALDKWSVEDYKKQWYEGLERIKTHNISCLVADITIFKRDLLVNVWILYKIDSIITLQNHILNGEIIKQRSQGLPPFNDQTCYLYIPSRETTTDDGDNLLELEISYDDFFKSLDSIYTPS